MLWCFSLSFGFIEASVILAKVLLVIHLSLDLKIVQGEGFK